MKVSELIRNCFIDFFKFMFLAQVQHSLEIRDQIVYKRLLLGTDREVFNVDMTRVYIILVIYMYYKIYLKS